MEAHPGSPPARCYPALVFTHSIANVSVCTINDAIPYQDRSNIDLAKPFKLQPEKLIFTWLLSNLIGIKFEFTIKLKPMKIFTLEKYEIFMEE